MSYFQIIVTVIALILGQLLYCIIAEIIKAKMQKRAIEQKIDAIFISLLHKIKELKEGRKNEM